MRKTPFANGEYYHIYNRGVEKRNIVSDKSDIRRFLESMQVFNTTDPIGSIHENRYMHKKERLGGSTSKLPLVSFVAYCLNPNHFHFILHQEQENGIARFMHRLGTGYTMYFNVKYERSGGLFQGRFRAKHIASNEYLLHLSAYVNLNYRVHGIKKDAIYASSWEQYMTQQGGFCDTRPVLSQMTQGSTGYAEFATKTLTAILKKREKVAVSDLLIE